MILGPAVEQWIVDDFNNLIEDRLVIKGGNQVWKYTNHDGYFMLLEVGHEVFINRLKERLPNANNYKQILENNEYRTL